jgi:serine/threonine-protein kinase HipA
MNSKCLYCYQELKDNTAEYHPKCSRHIFGSPSPPELPYALSNLYELAEKIIRNSVTVPGVQEKLSLHLDKNSGGAGRLTLVGLWGDYILKPPAEKYPDIAQTEDLTMHLGSIFGLSTVPHSLIRLSSGELAYITKRIDRKDGHRIFHMEDLCQLSGRLTEHKYRGSMEKTAKTIAQFSSHPMFDMVSFFSNAVFSFICGNADMHLKNFSLYYRDSNLIQLSPAYDLVATRLLISEKDDPEESALTINGKKSKLSRSDFDKLAENIGLTDRQTLNVYKRMAASVSKALAFIEQSFISDAGKAAFQAMIIERISRLKI